MKVVEKIMAGGAAVIGAALLFALTCFSAWITHIVDCFQDGEWGFLLVGALFFPLAVIHGIGLWFGFWS